MDKKFGLAPQRRDVFSSKSRTSFIVKLYCTKQIRIAYCTNAPNCPHFLKGNNKSSPNGKNSGGAFSSQADIFLVRRRCIRNCETIVKQRNIPEIGRIMYSSNSPSKIRPIGKKFGPAPIQDRSQTDFF